eukprot:SAG22_NODE_424_length_10663_cov_93.402026_2_plen_95_part_00
MDLFSLNNHILGIIQHKVFLKKLIEHRDKFNFDKMVWTDDEGLDRLEFGFPNRDGYYFEEYYFIPFYDSDGNVFRHKCLHEHSKHYVSSKLIMG